LARIAALVPPPRYPLTRLAGVLAPHSTWRAAVVKYGRDEATAPPAAQATTPSKHGKKRKRKAVDVDAAQTPPSSSPRTALGAAIVKPVAARIDWASLLRRIYLDDVLACPCGRRRRIIADVDDPTVIEAILAHLGLPTTAPPIAQARSPARDGAAA
jgi:hypothetical protein